MKKITIILTAFVAVLFLFTLSPIDSMAINLKKLSKSKPAKQTKETMILNNMKSKKTNIAVKAIDMAAAGEIKDQKNLKKAKGTMILLVKKKRGVHPKVRVAAANGLAKLNVQPAKEILKKMAKDEKNNVVKTAFTNAYNTLDAAGKKATPNYSGTPSYYGSSDYYGTPSYNGTRNFYGSPEYYGSYGY